MQLAISGKFTVGSTEDGKVQFQPGAQPDPVVPVVRQVVAAFRMSKDHKAAPVQRQPR